MGSAPCKLDSPRDEHQREHIMQRVARKWQSLAVMKWSGRAGDGKLVIQIVGTLKMNRR